LVCLKNGIVSIWTSTIILLNSTIQQRKILLTVCNISWIQNNDEKISNEKEAYLSIENNNMLHVPLLREKITMLTDIHSSTNNNKTLKRLSTAGDHKKDVGIFGIETKKEMMLAQKELWL